MIELKELRTSHSKTYDLGNGKRQVVANVLPVHIEKNGKLEEIDTTIKNGKVRDGIYHVDILKKSIGFKSIDKKTGNGVTVEVDGASYFPPKIEGNIALWENVFPGVDIRIVICSHRVRIYRTLKNESAQKSCVWRVTEDGGSKEIYFKPDFVGFDAEGRETKHRVEKSSAVNGSYTVTDEFLGRVVVRQGKKRIKEEFDAAYPVIIDPTVDVFVTASGDDGLAYKSSSGTAVNTSLLNIVATNIQVVESAYTTGYAAHSKGFTRFNSITIPQGSTINSAIIRVQISYGNGVNPVPVIINAKDANNPAAPTNFAQAFSPGTLASNVVTTNVAHSSFVGYQKDLNVQAIVQELVNSYDYSSESMLFFYKTAPVTPGGTRKQIQWFSYDRDPEPAPELIIDYTAGASTNIKTWNGLADASVKTVNGVTRANTKTKNGLA